MEKMIIDADLCIKLGASSKYKCLEEILPQLTDHIYMHKVAFEEVKVPESAKQQLNRLIETGVLTIVDDVDLPELEAQVYEMTRQQLSNRMIDRRHPRKNRGEVCALAYAKATGIPIFATDEMNLQQIIDSVLNVGLGEDIRCFRIKDIVEKIKRGETSYQRKEARLIWRLAGKNKETFDAKIWPIEE